MTHHRENLATAFASLTGNWLRTGLTTLGIVIGVASVVLLVSIGQGVKDDVTRQIEGVGTNVVIVVPGKLEPTGQPDPMSTLGISTLTDEDVVALIRIPGVARAVPIMFVFGSFETGRASYSALVMAAPTGAFQIRPQPPAEGRFYTLAEDDQRVCVLGNGPKQDAFGGRRAVGSKIVVRGVPFTVVGVMKAEEPSLFPQGSLERVVFLPFHAARSAYGAGQINRIILTVDYRHVPASVVRDISRTLLADHGGHEDFGILTQQQLLGLVYRVFTIVTSLLVGIGAISLVVAGIGIMNIMLVTVTERTREIGIRKTVGATRQDIFVQFLTEAVTLSVSGGILGTILAAIVCRIIAHYSALQPVITWQIVALATGACFVFGVIFGVTPAIRAARLDPVEALRYE